MPKSLLIGLCLLGAIFAGLLTWRLWPAPAESANSPSSGPSEAPALPVFTQRIDPTPLRERVFSTGTIRAAEEVELQSEISGRVVEIAFTEGTTVEKGAVLVRLDDAELRAQLSRTTVELDLARSREERQARLLEQRGTSQEAYDASLNEVRVLEAERELLRARLTKTEIRAPFAGRIGLRFVSPGTILSPGNTIATLQSLDQVKVDFSVSERHLNRIRTGIPVTFTTPGVSDQFEGEVIAIEPRIDAATRTLLLRAAVDNPRGLLLPGAFARIELSLEEISDALLVPTTALLPGLSTNTLYVVEDGRAAARRVRTGVRTDREIQIIEGLEPGEVVITSGVQQMRSGLRVEPRDREDTEAPAGAGDPST
ncbi:MAG: efflux RND transporter periplasmic adaptor subunit [Puniceicoccaceae bacterium]|nr:MAG: efflux RND transporter periplasmic adaptor subunit [Puniceicoccaceae bacterium]